MNDQPVAVEFEGDRQVARWQRSHKGRVNIVRNGSRSKAAWTRVVAAAFLPDGYPTSVTDDYLAFQVWDSLQALCRSGLPLVGLSV